jgi:hypothetical protein
MLSPTFVLPRSTDRDLLAHLAGLTPQGRLADYRAGLFTRHQLSLWATHYPDEIPLVNGELPWIALNLADHDS